MAFFAYWLRKMFTMEEHKTKATLDVQERMRKYESNYGPGDKTMKSLYDRMRRHFPNDSLNPEPREVRSEETFEASRGDARLQASHSRATTPDGSNSRVSADATVACIRRISPNEFLGSPQFVANTPYLRARSASEIITDSFVPRARAMSSATSMVGFRAPRSTKLT